MDDLALGRLLRAVRRRRGWRQADLAAAAGCSQSLISHLEAGDLAPTTLALARRVFGALEVRIVLTPSWRGADIDRLVDADHAALVGAIAARLERAGWESRLEVTYSEFGERGSIDVLGLRRDARAAVIVEAKSDIGSTEALGRRLDEKTRLAPVIVERVTGWRPTAVARLVVLPDTGRLRRLVKRTPTIRRMFPAGGLLVRAWLDAPGGALSGLIFLPGMTLRNGRKRIRRAGARGGVGPSSARGADRPNAPQEHRAGAP